MSLLRYDSEDSEAALPVGVLFVDLGTAARTCGTRADHQRAVADHRAGRIQRGVPGSDVAQHRSLTRDRGFAVYLVGQFWDIQLRLPALIANSVFFAVTMVGIVRHVLRESWAVDSLFGALCVYLLAAVFFGLQYMIISMLIPGSFAGNQSDFDLFYFSVVTLTTVGYGDIQPVSPLAQSLAGIEAIIGQLYLAVLVGWLVGTIKLSASSTKLSANSETTQRTSVS